MPNFFSSRISLTLAITPAITIAASQKNAFDQIILAWLNEKDGKLDNKFIIIVPNLLQHDL